MYKNAGKTRVPIGTMIRILSISGRAKTAMSLVGVCGSVADPGIVYDEKIVCAVLLEKEIQHTLPFIVQENRVYLLQGDTFEIVDTSTAIDFPEVEHEQSV